MLRVLNIIVFVISLLVPVFTGTAVMAATETTTPRLIISEVKVRYDVTNLLDFDEYIEIYNASEQPIDLANYNFEYYNATNPSASQQPVQKPLFAYLLDAHSSLTLAKQPIQIADAKLSPFSSLSDSGGRLRLVTSEGIVEDEIAWTNTQTLASAADIYPAVVYQCNSSTILCNSNRVQSLTRETNSDESFDLTNPVWHLEAPSPVSSELLAYPIQTPEPVEVVPDPPPITDPQPPQVLPTCEGMIISEVLPNPSGADTGKEYIELYNPTLETINLIGCSLQTSSSTKKYVLPEREITPNSYGIFFGSDTGLTLPNSAGGTVWLLSPTDELMKVNYPGGIEDDESWSLINDVWQATFALTPGSTNLSLLFKPCAAGQIRNSVSNRCEAPVVAAVSTLAPCKAGQERSPETNRCHSVGSVVSALSACKAGQERNPETNRCRNPQSDSGPGPCPQGQERNPDTNRCRVVSASTGKTLAAVTDVQASPSAKHPQWWLAVLSVLVATGYAVFEWRKDMAMFFHKTFKKIK